ncbi:phytochrome-like protein cph2 [mine drainage metagenome]|uniref:Phytochrome-like protein cph2 n=1 Tax=mine drainage metagenome TaxID=410659 RepID=A0A1J5QMD7_9ZZZZ
MLHLAGRLVLHGPNFWWDLIFYNAVVFGAGVFAWLGSDRADVDRLGARALSLAIFIWGIGSSIATWSIFRGFERVSTYGDIGYVLYYPLALLGIARLLRRASRLKFSEILDALIVGLGVGAVGAALALRPLMSSIFASSTSLTFTGLLYPIADLVLFAYVAAAIKASGRHLSPRTAWLASGMVLFAITDGLFLYQSSMSSYTFGTWLDSGWLLGFAALGESVWHPSAEIEEVSESSIAQGLALASGMAILTASAIWPALFPTYALIPASATLVAAFIRMGLSLREARRLSEEELLARTDELTGLANRRLFVADLSSAVTLWSSGKSFGAVMIIDLDGFKEVNDSLGHLAGDALLRGVAGRLNAKMPRDSLLARLGGDEFGVIMRSPRIVEDSDELARQLRESLLTPFQVSGVKIRVDASIGIAYAPHHGEDASILLRRADIAMYRAKRGHLGVSVWDESADEISPDRAGLAEELSQGMRRSELVLYYQPIVSLIDDRVEAVEALMRWQHPRLGILNPEHFLPLAERIGLLHDITISALTQGLQAISGWSQAGVDTSIAVNISARDLIRIDFLDSIEAALESSGVDASSLILEITEDVLLVDPGAATRVINQLAKMRVRIAIDDFGTGFSSLSYLQQLPVHPLKLDRSFVAHLFDAGNAGVRASAVAKAVIDLAKSLGLACIAEGVEGEMALLQLRELGCTSAQGRFVAPPMAALECREWLSAHQAITTP